MKYYHLSKKIIIFIFFISTLTFTVTNVAAQAKEDVKNQLTLAQLKAMLQADNGKTMSEKNSDAIVMVADRGFEFGLTVALEKEIRASGANDALVKTIRIGGLLNQISKHKKLDSPSLKPGYTWTDKNVVQDGQLGMNIHAMFTTKNLKGVPCTILYTFKTVPSSEHGEITVKGISNKYKALNSDLRPKSNFTPDTRSTVYKKLTTFVPYSEFKLAKPKTYTLQLGTKLVTANGKISSLFDSRRIFITLPKDPSKNNPVKAKEEVVIDKVWTKYNVTENGKLGMIVHVKLNAKNLKGKDVLLQTFFSNQKGPLKAKTPVFSTKAGHTALNRKFTPRFNESLYEDIPMFIPYEEFSLDDNVDLITMTTKASTFKDSIPLSKPKKTEFIHNLKLDFK